MKNSNYLFILLFMTMAACSGNQGSLLPPSSGTWGEIILTMDSAKWRGQLGDEIRNTFMPVVEGLPREEPLFSIKYVDPLKLNSVLKSARNMIFVTSFESKSQQTRVLKNYFTKGSVEEITKDSTRFLHINEDDFAVDQKVMYLFGNTDKQLIYNLRENREKLQDYFNNRESERLIKSLYNAKEVKGINDHLIEKYHFLLRVPFGYQIADEEDDFVWLRNLGAQQDKDIFITFKPYTSEDQLSAESLIEWRNETAKKYLFEDPAKPETFLLTETIVPPIAKIVNIIGKYGVEIKGLWKTNNLSMGGPFISYSFVDEGLNRLYYIEGFLYSPGKPQREFMRELKVILSTFRTESEQKPK